MQSPDPQAPGHHPPGLLHGADSLRVAAFPDLPGCSEIASGSPPHPSPGFRSQSLRAVARTTQVIAWPIGDLLDHLDDGGPPSCCAPATCLGGHPGRRAARLALPCCRLRAGHQRRRARGAGRGRPSTTSSTPTLERNGLPGGAVAVVKDGETVYERGFGEGSDGEPVTENSRLRTESLSKSVTAFAVLQLVDEGVVDLDGPVRSYLPELEMEDERIDEVTVRQLLSHTSGIETPTIIPPAADLRAGGRTAARMVDGQRPGDAVLLQQRELLDRCTPRRGRERRAVRGLPA